MFNTIPNNPYPPSTAQMNKGDNEELNTRVQALETALATKTDTDDLAPTFDATSGEYAVGDYVIYNGVFYRFKAEHSAGNWDVSEVDEVTVGEVLKSLKSGLTNVNVALSVPDGTGKNVLSLSLNHIKSQNDAGTWVDNVYTVNGVTYTVNTNSDGAVTGVSVYGSKTDTSTDVYLVLAYGFPTSKYSGMLLSGCPNMGGDSYIKQVIQEIGGSWRTLASDDGSTTGVKIGTSSQSTMRLRIAIGNSFNVAQAEAVSIYPMIRDARIDDATFAPYIPSVESRIEAVESEIARLVCTEIVYDDSASLFTLPSGVPKPKDGAQIMVYGRNRSTGAIYALWFDNSASGFKIGKILDGSAPADGISISVQYIA